MVNAIRLAMIALSVLALMGIGWAIVALAATLIVTYTLLIVSGE